MQSFLWLVTLVDYGNYCLGIFSMPNVCTNICTYVDIEEIRCHSNFTWNQLLKLSSRKIWIIGYVTVHYCFDNCHGCDLWHRSLNFFVQPCRKQKNEWHNRERSQDVWGRCDEGPPYNTLGLSREGRPCLRMEDSWAHGIRMPCARQHLSPHRRPSSRPFQLLQDQWFKTSYYGMVEDFWRWVSGSFIAKTILNYFDSNSFFDDFFFVKIANK